MVKIIELENGIQVILDTMPHLRTVSFGVWVKVGSVNETIENNGISHVIEHCLFKGTKTRSAKQLAGEISAIGDQLNAFTSKECTAFYGTTLTEYLPKMIELVGDMLYNSTFEEEALQKELGVILEEIDMYDDSPEDLVHELLEKNVWKNHALGYIISGEKSVVSKMTRQQLLDYMKLHYCGSNMVISVAGGFEEEQTIQNIKRYFEMIPKYGIGQYKTIDCNTAPIFHRCLCERTKDVEQLYMNLAFPTIKESDEQRHTQVILNGLLGGSNNSRLFQQIREELGLAYSVYSYSSLFHHAGLFHVDVIINPDNAKQVYDKLNEIFIDFATNPVKEQEVNSLYHQIRIEMIMGSESARNHMERNAKALLNHGRYIPLEEGLQKLSKVTNEMVCDFSAKYLNMEQAGICFVGDIKEEVNKIKDDWNRKQSLL